MSITALSFPNDATGSSEEDRHHPPAREGNRPQGPTAVLVADQSTTSSSEETSSADETNRDFDVENQRLPDMFNVSSHCNSQDERSSRLQIITQEGEQSGRRQTSSVQHQPVLYESGENLPTGNFTNSSQYSQELRPLVETVHRNDSWEAAENLSNPHLAVDLSSASPEDCSSESDTKREFPKESIAKPDKLTYFFYTVYSALPYDLKPKIYHVSTSSNESKIPTQLQGRTQYNMSRRYSIYYDEDQEFFKASTGEFGKLNFQFSTEMNF